MFGTLGPLEIILIVLALILLFGVKRVPELIKNMGESVKIFKKTVKEIDEETKIK